MEELSEVDKLIQNFLNKEITYTAQFNPKTGKVNRLGPSESFSKNDKNIIEVDKDLAEQVLTGDLSLADCYVDVINESFEIVQTKSITKIDDVLHRIINVDWTDIDKPDIYITCKNNSIKIELSDELGGSFKLPEKLQPVTTRKIFWAGDTRMNFLVTDYNDPHIVHNELKLVLQDLLDGPVIFKGINFDSKKSLYTRRIFKNYVLETE